MCSACLASGKPVSNTVDYERSTEDGAAYRSRKSLAAASLRHTASVSSKGTAGRPTAPSPRIEESAPVASAAAGAAAAALAQGNSAWLFTYASGTLVRDGVHHSMLADALFIGEFRTLTPYPLVVSNSFFAPYVLDVPGTGTVLQGEVYSVSGKTLAAIDKLQNVGDMYTRRPVRVSLIDDPSFTASAVCRKESRTGTRKLASVAAFHIALPCPCSLLATNNCPLCSYFPAPACPPLV